MNWESFISGPFCGWTAFTEAELEEVKAEGRKRQEENLLRGLKDAHGYDGSDGFRIHEEGMIGEATLAGALRLPWKRKGKYREPDVGEFESRFTPRSYGSLILRPGDSRERVWWLITPTRHKTLFALRGWCYGHEGMQPQFLKAPGGRPPAWFVPQEFLHRWTPPNYVRPATTPDRAEQPA